MSQWLKQSTAATIIMGPFVDSTDGFTPETALTLTQAETRLSKNGGAFAQKNEATSATHGEEGNYLVTLDTTDTNTLGRIRVSIYVAGALPVWADFMVVPANVWDSMFGADLLQVDAREHLGTAYATPTVAGVPEVDLTHIGGDAQSGTDLKDFADAGYDPATNKVEGVKLTDTVTALTNLPSIPANWITTAGITDGAFTAAKFAAGAFDAVWTVAARTLTAFDASFKTGYALSAAGVQAIWDALTSALTTVGSIGKLLVDNINATITSRASQTTADAVEADTQDIQSRLPAALLNGRMESNVAAISDDSVAADRLETMLDGTGGNQLSLGKLVISGSGTVLDIQGGGVNSPAARIQAINASGIGHALRLDGQGTGNGLFAIGGTQGNGILAQGGSTSGDGIRALAATLGDGIEAVGAGGGFDINADIEGSLSGAVGSVTGAVGSVTGNVGGNVVGSVASVTAGVTLAASAIQAIWDALTSALTTAGSIGKLLVDNINATISSRSTVTTAEVNAEVVDALATDTYAEPTGAPAATAALSAKINYLYMALRNKLTITSSTKTFCDDSGAAEWSKTLADDGTTYTESEGV